MSGPERMPCAVAAAETGSRWWALATSTQRAMRRDTVDRADLYGLAGEVVATLCVLEDLAEALARQTQAYRERGDLRDDEGAAPTVRLAEAALVAVATRYGVAEARGPANGFWSAIGHIGLDHQDDETCEGGTQ